MRDTEAHPAEARAVANTYSKAGMRDSAAANANPRKDDGLRHGAGCPCHGCSVQDT